MTTRDGRPARSRAAMGKDKGGGGGSRGAPVVTLEQFADALITSSSSSSSSSSSGAKSGRGGGGGGGKHAHKPLAKGVESLTLRDDPNGSPQGEGLCNSATSCRGQKTHLAGWSQQPI